MTRSIAASKRLADYWLYGVVVLSGVFIHACTQPKEQSAADDRIFTEFQNPPMSARPRAWWHWMNGNVTIDGIAKDLAWMAEIGLGGLQNFDASLTTPQIVENRLVYMEPDWQEAFRFAVETADGYGLEFAIAASPGWSETGGPWVPPEDGMKKLVWSTLDIAGGQAFDGSLPAPPGVTGAFQDLPFFNPLAAIEGESGESPQLYADAAVLAFPYAQPGRDEAPVAKSADGTALDTSALIDSSLTTGVEIDPGTVDEPGAVVLEYAGPRTVRSATLFLEGILPPFGDPTITPALEAQQDGEWRTVTDLPVTNVPATRSFAPVTASTFRVVMYPYSGPRRVGLNEGAPGAAAGFSFELGAIPAVTVTDFRLSTEPRVDHFEAKAGFEVARDYYALETADADDPGVPPDGVIDLTDRLGPDGRLDWTLPPGDWRVLRLGYSLTGKTNHPATEEATGLEVDKYDGEAVRRYLQTYLDLFREAAGSDWNGDAGLDAILTDSIEVGASNWTPRLVERFRELRGYDPVPWLPALTGTIVGSRQQSDAFLYDFRHTLADLLVSEHYATVKSVAAEHGIKVYGEALEDVRPSMGDDMSMRAHADVPMAALWLWDRGSVPRPTLLGDMKGASSVAHVYGQNLAAAESMTAANSPWAFAPSDLRRVIDLEFAHGINLPVIHTSVHQPLDDRVPGLALFIFGQYFNRHETWAGMARPWIDYIARNSYLLQQGRNFADVAYFYGEEMPLTALFAFEPLDDTPAQYAFDFVNADAILNLLSVENGKLVAPGGASYEALYLGGTSHRMTLPLLRKLAELADAGATIIGGAPESSPSLADDEADFAAVVERLWTGGRVIAGRDIGAALGSIGLVPDFAFDRPQEDSEVLFVHRLLDDGHVYWVNNRNDRAESIDGRFRVTGMKPEIWRADTGGAEPVSYRMQDGVTVVPLQFLPEESFFVVFREPTSVLSAEFETPAWVEAGGVDGPWDITFQPGRGAPASTTLERLASLSEHTDPGIRYFSGTANYSTQFDLPDGVQPGDSLLLDLGRVGDVAEVLVNGDRAGIAWKAPNRVDVGSAVRAGSNALEVRVANLWVNRLIGDAQPGAEKIAFTTVPTYEPDAPLRPSGLIGPVRLLASGDGS